MGKIIIRADDSFESVAAAKPANLKEHQERVKELKKDVSIATKIASQNKKLDTLKETLAKLKGNGTRRAVTPQATKARIETVRGKIKSVREVIKALKGELSTPLNAKLERATEQLTKAQQAKADHSKRHLPRNQKTPRAGDSATVQRSEKASRATQGGAGRPFLRRNIRKLANQIAITKRQISDAKTPRARRELEASLAKLETSLKSAQTSLRNSKPVRKTS